MKQSKEITIEQNIINAAIKVFVAKGLAGARMQEIADRAGINRTMLHYYFRNKEKLYEVVFLQAVSEMQHRLEMISKTDMPILEKIKHFIQDYIEDADQNPEFDMFFLTEFHNNKERMKDIFTKNDNNQGIRIFITEIEKAVEKKELVGNPTHIFLNLMSMLIFPFAGASAIQILLDYSTEQYQEIIKERTENIYTFFVNATKP